MVIGSLQGSDDELESQACICCNEVSLEVSAVVVYHIVEGCFFLD